MQLSSDELGEVRNILRMLSENVHPDTPGVTTTPADIELYDTNGDLAGVVKYDPDGEGDYVFETSP